MGVLMKSKCYVAELAMGYPAAGLTNLVRRITAPVLKKYYLFILRYRPVYGIF